jgi:hypothetical protein
MLLPPLLLPPPPPLYSGAVQPPYGPLGVKGLTLVMLYHQTNCLKEKLAEPQNMAGHGIKEKFHVQIRY